MKTNSSSSSKSKDHKTEDTQIPPVKTGASWFKTQNQRLVKELQRLQQITNIGHEVKLQWLPREVQFNNGKQLAEQVIGDTIFIYSNNPINALGLVRHGFMEWILNQYSWSYRQLINKLVTLFEEQHYERKEKLIESLMNIFL